MNNVVAYNEGRIAHTGRQLDLIKKTYAADCNQLEFEQFIAVANRAGLDPLRRQIYAVVYSKNDDAKRKMSIITGIDGYRAIAARCGDYRPDDAAPVFEYAEALKSDTNPQGLISATVKAYKLGPDKQWHPVAGVAYWDEFAPLKEEWAPDETGKRRPTGRMTLDRGGKWASMPRLMLGKCAEAQALRKGWPDDVSGVYTEDETERSRADDRSAMEIIEAHDAQKRLAAIGGEAVVPILWSPDKSIENVPIGKFADMAAAFVKGCQDLHMLDGWTETNGAGLNRFWAHQKSDALALKQIIEARKKELAAAGKVEP